MALKDKRIITVAVTGAWPTRKDNSNLPVTPQEIADDVYSCWQAGAAVAHIHVREDDGTPSMRFERYQETVALIRAPAGPSGQAPQRRTMRRASGRSGSCALSCAPSTAGR